MVLVGYSPPTNISLTCIIELPASVDTPVNVSTVWMGPNEVEFIPRDHTSSINLGRRYSSFVTVNNIKNGSYICQATATSSSDFINGTVMGSQVYNIVSGK